MLFCSVCGLFGDFLFFAMLTVFYEYVMTFQTVRRVAYISHGLGVSGILGIIGFEYIAKYRCWPRSYICLVIDRSQNQSQCIYKLPQDVMIQESSHSTTCLD